MSDPWFLRLPIQSDACKKTTNLTKCDKKANSQKNIFKKWSVFGKQQKCDKKAEGKITSREL